MNNATKTWLIVGAVFIVVGLIVFIAVMGLNDWDFSKLSTAKFETNTHCVSEAFSDILVETDTADIRFVPSDTQECQVVCYELEKARHRVSVKDGCLTVQMFNERKWYDYIGIHIGTPKLTISLPEAAYRQLTLRSSTGDTEVPKEFSFEGIDISASTGDVECFASASKQINIQLSTGDVRLEDLSAGALDVLVSTGHVTASNIRCGGELAIRVSTGKAALSSVSCNTLTSTGSTGDLILKDVNVTQTLTALRSTGDIEFIKCDAGSLSVKTDTGDVTGSLLSDKLFMVETDTGHIDVPKTVTGGTCDITTSTGDIQITIEP